MIEDNNDPNHEDEPEISLSVEDFLQLNGDHYDAEEEAKKRKASDWFLLAARSYLHNELDLAITYFDKVLELEPENARAYANRADVYSDKGYYAEAHNDYMMAAHLGGQPAAELLEEFRQEMQLKKIMDDKGNFLVNTLTQASSSYLKQVDEAQLGDDMHIVDLRQNQTEDDLE